LPAVSGAEWTINILSGKGTPPQTDAGGADDLSNPCAKRYVFEFGYVTIPLMSLTAFLLVLALLGLRKSFKSTEEITEGNHPCLKIKDSTPVATLGLPVRPHSNALTTCVPPARS
jgi:hypothetical protein